jgi:hypothetical protein
MKAALTVRYKSGRQEQFEVELWGGAGAEGRLDEFLTAPNVALQTATELVIIPASAIESLSIALPKNQQGKPAALQGIRAARRLT